MKRRIVSMFTALFMLGSIIGLVTATPVFAAYHGACVGDNNNEHIYLVRDRNIYPGATFTGARGEDYVGYYEACTPGITGQGANMDVIATVDGDTGGGYNLAQCGVGNITGEGTHFWWTPYSNGVWARFPNAPNPRYGDHIECIVRSGPSGVWEYTLHNVSTGNYYYASSPRYGVGSTQVWWGFEVSDSGDEMGGHAGTGNHNEILKPGYWFTQASGLWYATGDDNTDLHFLKGYLLSAWHYNAYQSGGFDAVEAWTDSNAH